MTAAELYEIVKQPWWGHLLTYAHGLIYKPNQWSVGELEVPTELATMLFEAAAIRKLTENDAVTVAKLSYSLWRVYVVDDEFDGTTFVAALDKTLQTKWSEAQ